MKLTTEHYSAETNRLQSCIVHSLRKQGFQIRSGLLVPPP